ncbi:PTS beta-glucoside transporter subunit IIBCA [Mammaliicoccus sciuri]|uniref:PTS beta-glucoside transporter subunit IIBCA n=1 Tax=Mammaliicoccus sciuri TaxID=1296 RepID=UPI000734BCA2|nr:glucose PTS transporter subunit IIA [Mammaliicoccus sciuri]KTT79418.1 PTS sucrose transporter subunit IIABC [Mammaliicoccus sciuri]MBO1207482.1 PTS glucose transporter subunit IIA [Mammaliicoccus sciuri]MCD8885071.1 glucose PTS transporter subunit IIA [Mammaliicoccus sciuri]MDU0267221.1 glucose PTS transporter subunit IIA [Mammaliicoccus sciuri]MEB7396580.1 glucose PTS transporter subunit IIA [Mammaliicoccus sciuri]
MGKDNNKYKNISEQIVKVIGIENIESVTHCATRLRLSVHDRESIDDDAIEEIDEVKGVFYTGGQYQIILGTGIVNNVYDEMTNVHQFDEVSKETMKNQNQGNIQRAIRLLADVFIPIIPVLGATGLFLGLKGVVFNESVLGVFGATPEMIPNYIQTLITVLTDTAFAFLPAFIAWSAFRTFGGTPVIGFLIGLMLVSPALPNAYDVAGGDAKPIMVAGFIPIVGYQGSILTALFTGLVGAKLEKRLRKIMPNALDLIFTPFFVILLMMIFSLFIMGPIVHGIESVGITVVKSFIHLPLGLGGLLIGFIYPLAVMTGLHHMFIIVETSLLASTGFNPLITLAAMYGFSNAGVCLALSLRSQKSSFKTAGISATITQLLGVSEPALFGVVLRSGIKPLSIMLLCSALGGSVLALLNIQANSYGLAVILSPLMYIYDFSQLLTYIIVGVATFVLGFIITQLFGIPKSSMSDIDLNDEKVSDNLTDKHELKAINLKTVTNGEILSLADVDDPVFSQRMMGEGFGIIPNTDEVYAPVNAKVTLISDSKHAIGFETEDNLEILVHMGIDTVEIKEDVFNVLVKEGDIVQEGQLIAKMDINRILELGKQTTILTVITNSNEKVNELNLLKTGQSQSEDNIAKVIY